MFKYSNVDYACLSEKGNVKLSNEDAACIIRNKSGDILMVVADGIGGQNRSDYASKMVIDYFSSVFQKKNSFFNNFFAKRWLTSQIKKVNKIIFQLSKKSKIYYGMGTTVVVALIRKNKIIIINVGDSRAYLFDSHTNTLCLLSKDHDFLSASNVLKNKSDSEKEKYKNVILNAIGVYSYIDPYCNVIKADKFQLLLCSDGLTKTIEESEIINILSKKSSAAFITRDLINSANKNGGIDNISVAYCFRG
ncbi:MAG: serine/threonine-protein phosphatase [Bacilli bacterium]|nr:serine/threonine-protein phosphatase [Bacilli bacterium]